MVILVLTINEINSESPPQEDTLRVSSAQLACDALRVRAITNSGYVVLIAD